MNILLRFGFLPIFLLFTMVINAQIVDTLIVRIEMDSLLSLSHELLKKEEFENAKELIEFAQDKSIIAFGSSSSNYAKCIFNEARAYHMMDSLSSAKKLYIKAKDIWQKTNNKSNLDFAANLINLSTLYDLSVYDTVEKLLLEAKLTIEEIGEKEHRFYSNCLINLSRLYEDHGQFEKCEPLLIEAKEIIKRVNGEDSPNYADILFKLGMYYESTGRNKEAESMYVKSISIYEKTLGKSNIKYIKNEYNIANLYSQTGREQEAELLYLNSKKTIESEFGKNHPDYPIVVINLGELYVNLGRYEEAEICHQEAKKIRESIFGAESPAYARCLNNLANLYSIMGRFDEAEPLYIQAKFIFESTLGIEHPVFVRNADNLALLYSRMGLYTLALPVYLESKKSREKIYGKTHPEFARTLNNLGGLYSNLGDFKLSENLLQESKSIMEKYLGDYPVDYASILISLSGLYLDFDSIEKAKLFLFEAEKILKSKVGKDHYVYAITITNLARVYEKEGDFEKSEFHYREAISVWRNISGEATMDYANSLMRLANFYHRTNDKNEINELYKEANFIQRNFIAKASTYLSENEMAECLTFLSDNSDHFFSVSIDKKIKRGILISEFYENILFSKEYILGSLSNLRQIAHKDSSVWSQLSIYNSQCRKLATQNSLPTDKRNTDLIYNLKENTNSLEKSLGRSILGFTDARRQVACDEVRNTLLDHEVAIEFVCFKYKNYCRPTDSIMAVALVLLPQDTTPHLIPLFEEKQLQSLLEKTGVHAEATTNLYAARTGDVLGNAPVYGKELYNLIWRPLDSLLQKHDIKTVYFSPSGLLHRVSFAALPVNEKKVLSDQYALHQLGSTRSLVVKTPEPVSQNYTAAVFGGVQYDRSTNIVSDSTAPEITDNRLWTLLERPRTAGDDGFDYLPGTAQEAASLTRALQAQRVQVQTHTGKQASEEMLKSLGRDTVISPDILHIATHGFFFPDPEKRKEQRFGEENAFKWNENPLFRSGLALAGANTAWSGQPSPGNLEDGIATAYEISHLNLSNTKLVVLSACESGLGDIKGSEGVYGLQRAFKMAGADFLLVSLWQVPDKETVEFMDLFYKSWLGGKTIHEAFAKAQKKMRKKYKEVYKWGAWVLVE